MMKYGYGYMAFTGILKKGDQYFDSLTNKWDWVGPHRFGHKTSPEVKYRREINPGEGYEIVPVGGIRQEGDEYYSIEWRETSSAGTTIKEGDLVVRRKVAKPVAEPPKPCPWKEDPHGELGHKTVDGRDVLIFRTDMPGNRPIAGSVLNGDKWYFQSWCTEGRSFSSKESSHDLAIPKFTCEGWINVYGKMNVVNIELHETRAEAEKHGVGAIRQALVKITEI